MLKRPLLLAPAVFLACNLTAEPFELTVPFDFLDADAPPSLAVGQTVTFGFTVDSAVLGVADGTDVRFDDGFSAFTLDIPTASFAANGAGSARYDGAEQLLVLSGFADSAALLDGYTFLSATLWLAPETETTLIAGQPLTLDGFAYDRFEVAFRTPGGSQTSGSVFYNTPLTTIGSEFLAIPEPSTAPAVAMLALLVGFRRR